MTTAYKKIILKIKLNFSSKINFNHYVFIFRGRMTTWIITKGITVMMSFQFYFPFLMSFLFIDLFKATEPYPEFI